DVVSCAGLPCPVYIDGNAIKGIRGSETLVGGNAGDAIHGGPGDKVLIGGWGNDRLYAGSGGYNDLDPYHDVGDDPYHAGGGEGNDWYTVAGSGWIQSISDFRIVHRSGDSTVRVREDNPGKDQLEFNGGFDHLDDDGVFDVVGE